MKGFKKILIGSILSFLALVVVLRVMAADGDKATLGYDSENVRDIMRVNSDGNFVPGADDTYSLGTTSLRFSNVYSADATIGDDLTVTDDLAVNGDTTLGDSNPDAVIVNATTWTVRVQVNAIRISTAASGAANILTIDGSNRRVGIGNDDSPDATLEVVPQSNATYTLRISSTNGSTNLLAVNAETSEVEIGAPTPLFPRSSAQLAALAPRAANLAVINTDYNALCISTGTAAGAWVIVSSYTAAGSGVRVYCY